MRRMFSKCKDLEYLDLSNFNSENATDMSYMFNECNKLKDLNLMNFSINCITENMLTSQQKNKCNFFTNNKQLLKLYNSTY